MKQFLAIFLLSLVFASCQDNAELFDEAKENVNDELSLSKFRTPEQAMEAAADIASQFYGSNSRSTKSVDRSSVVCITGGTRSEIDTLLYIVNYGNNQGYAMIAGPSNLPPVYAVVDNGKLLNPDNISSPELQAYYNAAITEISDSIKNGKEPIKYMQIIKGPAVDWEAQPRVTVKWGQTGSLAKYCLNGKTGCAPLACAMAMSYIEQPTSLDITFPYAPVNHVTLNWNLIKSGQDNESAALLCRELGHRMQSVYKTLETHGVIATSTDIDLQYSVMKQLLNNRLSLNYLITYQESLYPHKYIKDSGVLVVNGFPNHEMNVNGHTFIVDGFNYYLYEEKLYKVTPGWRDPSGEMIAPEMELIDVLVHEETNLVHVNWGDAGRDNGYFKGNLLSLRNAVSYDDDQLVNNEYFDMTYNYNKFYSVK